jgi:hypothetical protein
MTSNPFKACLLALAVVMSTTPVTGFAATATTTLKAGVARLEITPALEDLPKSFKSIHDKLFVRALVLEEAGVRAAIVIADVPTFGAPVLTSLRQRIADEIHAPASNVVLATTHNHDSVRIDYDTGPSLLPASPRVADKTLPIVLRAANEALSNLQPARAGYAQGTTQLIERRARPPGTEHVLDEALADSSAPNRSLGVLEIENLSGEPIAFLFNSGLEPLIGLTRTFVISSDVAGATERYIEQRYGDKVVAMSTIATLANTPYNARRQGPQPPADPYALINAMGTLFGEDVFATAAWIKPMSDVSIRGAFEVLQCPGKITTPLNLQGLCSDAPGSQLPRCVFTTRDGPAVPLQIGALRIGDLTIVQTDADIATAIWHKVKSQQSAMLISTAYGPVHYVVEDKDYPLNTYPATATRAKPGCAAQGFVSVADKLIKATR